MKRQSGWGVAGMVVVGVLLQGAGVAAGKSLPDLTPKLDAPVYWDEHVILHGEVLVHDEGTDAPVQILNQYSGGTSAPAVITLKPKEIWLVPHGDGLAPEVKLEGYDHVLIDYSVSPMVVYLPGKERVGALAESCRLIQEIRRGTDMAAALTRATRAADAVAERYVLNALLAGGGKGLDEKLMAAVTALRADGSVELETRMRASDLLQVAALAKGGKKDDWEWIAGVLRKETNLEAESYRTLMERMVVNDGEERVRTIDLICEMALDMAGPMVRRVYVMSAGDLDRLIDGGVPRDAGNVKLWELCVGRMADPAPAMRTTAAWALWQFGNRLATSKGPRGEWLAMLRQAEAAIKKAEAQETAADMKIWLAHYRTLIEKMAAAPGEPTGN